MFSCGPRLTASAAERLKNAYVRMRGECFQLERGGGSRSAIPITVRYASRSAPLRARTVFACRQLEAIVRISESLAKMELSAFTHERHVEEALRLFSVSTLEAAKSGALAGELSRNEASLERLFCRR